MKKGLSVGLLLLFYLVSAGQIPSVIDHKKIDSLRSFFPHTKGKERVDLLNELAMNFAPVYKDSCLKYTDEAYELAVKLLYKKGEGICYFNYGNCHFFRMDLEKAILNYFAAEQLLPEYGTPDLLGNLYIQIALIQNYIHEHQRAGKYIRLARQQFSISGNEKSEMFTCRITGRSLNDNDSALVYFKDALDYYTMKADTLDIIKALIDISDYYFHKKRDSTGLAYGRKALKLAEINGNDLLAASALHKITNFYENYGSFTGLTTDLALASSLLYNAIEHLKKTNESYHFYLIAESYRELAAMQQRQGNYQNMFELAHKGIPYNLQFFDTYDTTMYPDISIRLWFYSEALGNMPMLSGLLRNYFTVKSDLDSMKYYRLLGDNYTKAYNRYEMIIQLNKISENFSIQLRDQSLELLSKENELHEIKISRMRIIMLSVGGFALLLLIIVALYFQQRKIHADHKALEIEQKFLRAQMNPHFLFNTLTSIQNYILAEKPDKANIFISRFAKLMRSYMDISLEELVPLESILSNMENYLELQKNRYNDKFGYSIKVDDSIDEFNTLLPPMLVQPFIENAVEHGIKHLKKAGKIYIRALRSDLAITIEIEDNGVGRKRAAELEKKSYRPHRSLSTDLTRDRINIINKKLKRKIKLEIIDLEDEDGNGTGTLVRVLLPVIPKG